MAIITGFMQRYTKVKTIGLCHSVQVCTSHLLDVLDMGEKKDGRLEKIAGEKHGDMVRFDYIDKLGYYCTESSEHNAEYNAFYIKPNRDGLIEKFHIPLDEYPRRFACGLRSVTDATNCLMHTRKRVILAFDAMLPSEHSRSAMIALRASYEL